MDKLEQYRALKELKQLKREKLLREARGNFFSYAQLIIPEVYKDDRLYLKELCSEFENFMESDEDVLLLNMPPRHAKSLTAGRFVEWSFGKDQSLRVMTGSYSEDMATDFSKSVRDTISEQKVDDKIVYSDIFPRVKIKQGTSAAKKWALRGKQWSYLATSPGGSATGKGTDLLIVDDIIKGIEDATNEITLEKQWRWFTQQMISRVERGGKIIIIMTRWHSNDLAGRVIKEMPDMGYKLRIVTKKALLDEETKEMLCDGILSYDEYQKKKAAMGPEIASANYQQEPIDIKGRLYQDLQTYDVPREYIKVWSYTDTADRGKDYLAKIVFGETRDGQAEVIDVLYTKEEMSISERASAVMIARNKVNEAIFEGNNGGVGYKRAVERICREELKHRGTVFKDFHQSANKESRILSNSSWVEQNIFFPSDWKTRWPEFYTAITTYQREGKNKHDDAPDALTGVAEVINKKIKSVAKMTKRPSRIR